MKQLYLIPIIYRTIESKRVSIGYFRGITTAEDYRNWKKKRHTGMKVSWRYREPSEPDYKFSETNKYFTLLANVIHQHDGPTQEVEDLLAEIREKEKLVKPDCEIGLLTPDSRKSIDKRFGNISMGAIYKEEISEENLKIAARIYFEIVFCPDSDLQIVDFYRNLFQNFALETILKTLTRILLEANENKHEHYQAAKTLFDKTTTMMDLEYRDIVAMTTGSSELKQYPQLKNHQFNQELSKMIIFFID